jgi:hypothetical protein
VTTTEPTADDFQLDHDDREEIEKLVKNINDAQAELRRRLGQQHDAWQTTFEDYPEEWRESEEGTAVQERIDNIGRWVAELCGGSYSVEDVDDSED